MHRLLQQALILDTETLGLQRGSGVHELAVYDLQTRGMSEFILKPNFVQVHAATAQEITKLATNSADVAQLVRKQRWLDVIKSSVLNTPRATDQESIEALKAHSPWLSRQLGKYPHLMGTESPQAHEARVNMLRAHGVQDFKTQTMDVAELLGSDGELAKLIQGKTVWLANAAFDSKQIGALVSGLATEGNISGIKATLQTAGPTADPLYTTGVEVNKAKVLAQQTGDWSHVWKAYNADVPKPGETAVRDVQDVLRSMRSYGQKLGLASQGDVYWGTGLDLSYRLMGSLEGGEAGAAKLMAPEVHRAAEDTAIHTSYVLERALKWTEALEHVHDRTPRGLQLLEQAKSNKGDLYDAAAYLKRQEILKPDLQQSSLVKRLARAHEDIVEQGKTYQKDGWQAISQLTQNTPTGHEVQVPVLQSHRVPMSSLDELGSFLQQTHQYPEADIPGEISSLRAAVTSSGAEGKTQLAHYVEQKTANTLEQRISGISQRILGTYNHDVAKAVSHATTEGDSVGRAARALGAIKPPSVLRNWGMFAAATATAGLLWSMSAGNANATRTQPSLLTYDYQNWLEHQAQFTGSSTDQTSGMSEAGLSGRSRKRNTDFGSPYAGPQASSMVFYQQKLLQEREKWLRQQYGATFYDPADGLFGTDGILARARHQGYSTLPGGTAVSSGYRSLSGKHLLKVNLGDGTWKASAEDADTILLKRGGIRGAVASLFGLNKGYSFRLAGIDSPEVTHPGQLSGGQPQGMTSLAGIQSMMAGRSDMELVFDPTQTTYGRSMGVLFAGDTNMNFDLVKRGLAAHLPFGKPRDSIINYQVMKGMETGAAEQGRGMWQHPFWKSVYGVTDVTGNRPTFNTLTKPEKLVESMTNVNTLALADAAEQQGLYSTALATEASNIGHLAHRGVDSVKPTIAGPVGQHYNSYLHELESDTSTWMRTKGTRQNSALSARDGYGALDKTLVVDSLSQTDSIWSRNKLQAFTSYDIQNRTRKMKQAQMQQNANHTMFDSQINHTRMR